MKLCGLVVVAAACGPGLVPRDTREVGREALAGAVGNPAELRELFRDSVVDGGLWFDDAACAAEFGKGEEVPKDRLDAFAACLAGLNLQPSPREDALGDVVVLDYAPGIELEARVAPEAAGPHLSWIGYASRRPIDALVPTITPSALESIRLTGDRNGPLEPTLASTLELDPTPKSHAQFTWLRVCVDETGAVTLADPFETTSIKASLGFARAAAQWTFKPFVIHDQPVAVCSLARMSYPPNQAPTVETLPLPPAPSRSHKNPLVYVEGAKERKLHEGHRVAGDKMIAPDDGTKTRIQKSKVDRITASFRICLDENGAAESVLPLKSSGFAEYDAKILYFMNKWRYEPYAIDGVPLPVCTAVTFIYSQR
ncbi:MAG: hypothetical protein ABI678_08720 [Kofleriaceae bacterium]